MTTKRVIVEHNDHCRMKIKSHPTGWDLPPFWAAIGSLYWMKVSSCSRGYQANFLQR